MPQPIEPQYLMLALGLAAIVMWWLYDDDQWPPSAS
jgi:hypothetical protein